MGLVEDVVGIIRLLELQQALVIRAEDDPPIFIHAYLGAYESAKSDLLEILNLF